MITSQKPINIFLSYAHKDESLLQKLETHLSLLKRQGLISTWYDRQIVPGTDWAVAIDEHLEQASIILLLVSANFLASDYCYGTEMQRAIQRHEVNEACVIPVLLRPVDDWPDAPFRKLKALPSNGKSITQWRNRDKAFADVITGIRQAIKDLAHRSQPMLCNTSSGIWNVPYARNLCFTGREDLLDQLHEKLTRARNSDAPTASIAALTQPQAVKGLGGIGKTQIAVEYAYRHRDFFSFILWVNAATEETLISSFASIADLLPSLPEKGETDQKKVVEAIKRWLERSDDRWLLIFDNADDIQLACNFFPKKGKGSIVLTTRSHAVGSIAEPIEVEKMGLIEGINLLLRRAHRLEHSSDEDINEAGNIVIALDSLPLALDQAGAYIEETQCSLSHYLQLYHTHSKELLARRGIQSLDYPHAVATTWSLSFQKIEQANPAATELLRLCAFLAPDAIPEEIVLKGASVLPPKLRSLAKEQIRLNDAISALLDYSLIRRNSNHTLTVHRLVQAVLRHQMSKSTHYRWVERTIRVVNLAFPVANYDNWSMCLQYLPHSQSCSMLIEEWNIATPEAAQLLREAGEYLRQAAQYELAELLFLRALIICEQIFNPHHLYTANVLDRVAMLYYDWGLYEKAEPLYQRALAIREQMLGYDHFDTITSLHRLALLYHYQGIYEKAEPLYQRVLAIREQKLGPDHPDTGDTINDLGLIYYDQGFYEKAEPLLLRSLEISERVFGPDHPETATSFCNLALLYKDQGLYEKAESFFLRDLSISERMLGPDHPGLTTTFRGLALLYKDQGLYEKAEPLFLRALTLCEHGLRPDHLDTAEALYELALFYNDLCLYEKAEPLFLRALTIREHLLGSDHPWTTSIYEHLAVLYQNQGLREKAESFFKKHKKDV